MNNSIILQAIVAAPLIGACVVPFAGRISERLRNWLALISVAVSFVLSCMLIPVVMRGEVVTFRITLLPNLPFILTADPLAVFMAIVSSCISVLILFYSFSYISHYENRTEYYAMVTLFLGAMMGLVFAGHLIYLYMFWEVTAIASWRLIGFFRKDRDIICADKAFLVTAAGALMMLIGFIGIYQQTGSFELAVIKESMRGSVMPGLLVGLILAGILSKSATLPVHTWLPDAGVAPSPVTALLHAAVLVKIGVYVFARLFIATAAISGDWHILVMKIACASAIVSACAALVETDLKRIIAYSTISQIGFIFFGLSINNAAGITGGLLYILMHGLGKAGLFLCAGIIEQNTKIKDITKLGGLMQTMPLTAAAFLLCSFSIMGIPPFGGFFVKYLVFSGAAQSVPLGITLAFLFGATLTIVYLLRTFSLVFLGEARVPAREGSAGMVATVMIFAVLSLLGGILVIYPARFAQFVTQTLGFIR